MFNFHRDQPYPGGFPSEYWASNAAMSRTIPTHGSMPESDQRELAQTFSSQKVMNHQKCVLKKNPQSPTHAHTFSSELGSEGVLSAPY